MHEADNKGLLEESNREEITEEERGFIEIFRLNKLIGRKEIIKEWKIGKLEITFNWRSKENLWGRFGGGWNWKLGFMIGGKTIIFNLLIFSLRFYYRKKEVLSA